jgi:lysylphosphatidylglycerol synthetase-like protein (DUF2156 family)
MKTFAVGRPAAVRAAQALLIANAVIWLGFGVASFIRIAELGAGSGTLAAVAVLMFGNAAAMLICGVGLGTRRRVFYWLALAVLIVNVVLTFTDQFGAFDLITLVIDLVIVGLLVAARGWFARREAEG